MSCALVRITMGPSWKNALKRAASLDCMVTYAMARRAARMKKDRLGWALLSGDAISEKSGADCKGFFHYFCHTRHSEVTEKVKIFG